MTFTESFKKIKNKIIAIDLDGTICTEERTFERSLAKPLDGAVEAISLLKANGNTIIFWTARGWEQYKMTVSWLQSNGFIYDQLVMGKPIVDMMIDDRARRFVDWKTLEV